MQIPFALAPSGAKPFDVAGLGQNSVDLLAVVREFPTSNTKQRLLGFARSPGGQIATALATCARHGFRARYVGTFGSDEFGQLGRSSLVAEGVDISAARTVAGATNQFAVILVDARSGDRTVLWDRHDSLEIPPYDVSREAVTSGRILLVDAQDTAAAAQAARYARAAGIPTVVDIETAGRGTEELLHQIDVIIAAEDLPAALTGHQDPALAIEVMAKEFGASLVCVTLGSRGSLACRGSHIIRTAGFRVDCVDSTGAGDVFRGAFIAACLEAPDGQVEQALEFANAAAALSCRGLGARGAIPSRAEVHSFQQAGARCNFGPSTLV
jgi:sugar/nucleoside kinase (ribokinase family)